MTSNEVWQNATLGRVVVTHSTSDGPRDEVVQANREFTITTRDRQLYQNRVVSEVYDPFTNGTLVPVELPDEVLEELDGNPNHLSEDDISTVLLGARVDAVDILRRLTAPAVVARLIVEARNLEVDRDRIDMLEQHMHEIDPQFRYKFTGASLG